MKISSLFFFLLALTHGTSFLNTATSSSQAPTPKAVAEAFARIFLFKAREGQEKEELHLTTLRQLLKDLFGVEISAFSSVLSKAIETTFADAISDKSGRNQGTRYTNLKLRNHPTEKQAESSDYKLLLRLAPNLAHRPVAEMYRGLSAPSERSAAGGQKVRPVDATVLGKKIRNGRRYAEREGTRCFSAALCCSHLAGFLLPTLSTGRRSSSPSHCSHGAHCIRLRTSVRGLRRA